MPEGRSIERARALRGLGRSLRATGDLEAAAEHLETAREVLEDEFGPVHLEVLRCVEGLGLAARDSGDYEKAAALFGEVVAALRPGGPGPSLGRALADLGIVKYRAGNLLEARQLLEEALPILRTSMGSNNPYVAEVLGKLAPVLSRLGDNATAESVIQEILAILPEDHSGTGIALHNLGMILNDKGELEEAAKAVNKALRVKRQAFGDQHESIAASLCLLGRIALTDGDFIAARESFSNCADAYSEDSPHRPFAWIGIGRSIAAIEGCPRAVEWYKKAYNLRQEVLGRGHYQTALAAIRLGACLSEIGQLKAAEDLLAKNLDILRSQGWKPDDERILKAEEYLNAVKKKMQDGV